MARAGPEEHDSQHIHNKAVFDGASQALAHLLPPYGTVLTDGQRGCGGSKWGARGGAACCWKRW